jgi:hypothetical protein
MSGRRRRETSTYVVITFLSPLTPSHLVDNGGKLFMKSSRPIMLPQDPSTRLNSSSSSLSPPATRSRVAEDELIIARSRPSGHLIWLVWWRWPKGPQQQWEEGRIGEKMTSWWWWTVMRVRHGGPLLFFFLFYHSNGINIFFLRDNSRISAYSLKGE